MFGPSVGNLAEFCMVTYHVLNTRSISWLTATIVTILAVTADTVLKVFSNMFYPTQTQIHREMLSKRDNENTLSGNEGFTA